MLVVAFCVVFLGLARWQWDRAHSVGGDWQNFGYALQWPLFAVFLFVAWLRFLWLEQHRDDSGTTPPDPAQSVTAPRAPVGTSAPAPLPAARGRVPLPNPEDDPDDELAIYNAYLAQLAERDRRR